MRYVLRRLVHALLLLVAVSILSFLLADLAPGEPLSELPLGRGISEETVASLRARYGLDRPLASRYLRWARSVLAGEFGFSIVHRAPAGKLLLARARNTLLLALVALFLVWATALPVGVWSAHRPRGLVARSAQAAASLLLATPTLVLGLALLLLAARVEFFPLGGMASLDAASGGPLDRLADRARHLLLPALALALGAWPVVYRHVRSAVGETLAAPFLQVARSCGIPTRQRLFRHALKAAANPLISLFGLSVGGLLSGSFLVEIIMSWPGLGPLMLEAILARDVHVVTGVVLLSSLFLVAGGLLADGLLYWLDPRTRSD